MDAVWSEISIALSGRLTPASLYTIVSCNRYDIRDKLLNLENTNTTINLNTSNASNLSDTTNTENSTLIHS